MYDILYSLYYYNINSYKNGWRPHHFACCSSDNFEIFSYLCDNYMENLGINKPIAKVCESILLVILFINLQIRYKKLLYILHVEMELHLLYQSYYLIHI